MSLLSWNCQGLGEYDDLTIPRLREMRKDHFPEIMFLMETMHDQKKLVDLQEWLGYDMIYTVNPIGKSDGIALFWKNSKSIDLKFVDKNLLDLHVQFGNVDFFVSCIYGAPVMKDKHVVWERLTRIGCLRKESWCMICDFNDILNNSEKLGGPSRSDKFFEDFGDMIRNCQMSDLPST